MPKPDDQIPGSPWWASPAFVSALVKLGAPTVIAFFLLWFMTQNVSRQLDAMQFQQASLMRAVESAEDQAGRTYMAIERVLMVLQVMCVNAAETDLERTRCMDTR